MVKRSNFSSLTRKSFDLFSLYKQNGILVKAKSFPSRTILVEFDTGAMFSDTVREILRNLV